MKKIIFLNIILQSILFGCIKDSDKKASNSIEGTKLNSIQTIISLNPSLTEELYLLKADNLLIANTIYCNRPAAARSKQKVGNLIDFDVESIIKLKPGLVLCTTLVNDNKIKKLKKVGIKVMVIPEPRSFNEICDNFLKLGKELQRKEVADEIIKNAKIEIASIIDKTESLPKKRVLIQIGIKPLFIVNKDYFINDYIKFSGGINIAEKADTGILNRESIVLNDPDVIIITEMGIAGKEEKQKWMKYNTIKAVKNKEIYIVDSEIFCSGTINSFMKSLKILTSLLHPEIKQ
jgi:iron complex transport system substrate-binding protein